MSGLIEWVQRRPPDLVIGGKRPYMLRWYVIPRNPLFNVYVHLFLRSDDDRALHCHPWANASVILDGEYTEHRIEQGGIHTRTLRKSGDWCVRWSGKIAHRIELTAGPCWTLFITGPRYREWGFHCQESGWIHHARFASEHDPGEIGKGCNQ